MWTTAEAAAATRRKRPFLPYTRNSYFRNQLGDKAVATRRAWAFREFMRSHPEQNYDYPRINGVEDNDWGTAYAMGREPHPVWRLVGEHHPKADPLFTRGFHAPGGWARCSQGPTTPPCASWTWPGDSPCSARTPSGSVAVRSAPPAAITHHASNGLDHRNPRSNDERNVTSRGRISDAMVIRKDLIRHGVANNTDLGHVLHLFLVETRSRDGFRHPMVGDESDKHGFGAEGERIAIASNVDLAKRKLLAGGLVIARTLQCYGCYIGDNAGSASALKAQQEKPVPSALAGSTAPGFAQWHHLGRLRRAT